MKERYRINQNAAANKENIIQEENYRFTILTPELFRMEYRENGDFVDAPTQKVMFRDFPAQKYTFHITSDTLEIDTGWLVIRYPLEDSSWKSFEVQVKLREDSEDTRLWHYGDKSHTLKGTTRTLDDVDGRTEIEEGLISREGFAILDDSSSYLIDENGELAERTKGNIDFYFFGYGHKYRKCIADFFRLTGNPPLLPRYALGNWWSRYHKYTQEEYQNLIAEFQKKQIPLAVAVIDMDWHITEVEPQYKSGWTGYTWNRSLFPEPEKLLEWLHEQNLLVSLNVHPALGVRAYEEAYPAMAEALGVDPDSQETIEFDPADPHFMEAYFQYVHEPLETMGVDFWWIDWQQGLTCRRPGLDPLWILNHYHFLDNQKNNKRAMILSRYAEVGSHRYPVGFSGDTIISWETLDFQPYFTATASNVGYCWWSHDIGGHMLGIYDEDLEVRWIQFGVFSPIFRLHCTSSPFYHKEPWNYSMEADTVISEFMRLRHRLIPYLYTMNQILTETGSPLMQPMYYAYPEIEAAYHVPNEYLFGSEMICHPITTPQIPSLRLGKVKTWLPEGMYVDLFTGLIYQGGRFLSMYRRIEECPVLLKAGAIVPLAVLPDEINDTKNPSELEVVIAAGANGSFTLYEDDGSTMDYKNGKYAKTQFVLDYNKSEFYIQKVNCCTRLVPDHRTYHLRFLGFKNPDNITYMVDDIQYPAEYEYNEDRNEIILKPIQISNCQQVTVQFAHAMRPAKNHILERCFDLLNYAAIPYLEKDEIYDVIKCNPANRSLGCLLTAGVEEELIGALSEILLSEE